MSDELVWVIGAGLLAALPGLIALLIYRRRSAGDADAGVRASAAAQAALLAQLQEQVTAQQDTIRFLTKRVNELEAARAREYADQEALREEAEVLRQEVRELRRGVQTLIQQMEGERLTPAWRPAEKPAAAARKPADPATALRDRIIATFNRDEIDDLAFRLGLAPDDLAGETKKARGRALVEYIKARGRLPELEALVNQERPPSA